MPRASRERNGQPTSTASKRSKSASKMPNVKAAGEDLLSEAQDEANLARDADAASRVLFADQASRT